MFQNHLAISKTFSWSIIAAMLLLLTGCVTMDPPPVKYQYIVIAPPDDFLIKCTVTPPPLPEDYFSSTPKQREGMLFKLSSAQYLNLSQCNNRLQELKVWKQKQSDLYKDQDKK